MKKTTVEISNLLSHIIARLHKAATSVVPKLRVNSLPGAICDSSRG